MSFARVAVIHKKIHDTDKIMYNLCFIWSKEEYQIPHDHHMMSSYLTSKKKNK